jgi:hypothetical protein
MERVMIAVRAKSCISAFSIDSLISKRHHVWVKAIFVLQGENLKNSLRKAGCKKT